MGHWQGPRFSEFEPKHSNALVQVIWESRMRMDRPPRIVRALALASSLAIAGCQVHHVGAGTSVPSVSTASSLDPAKPSLIEKLPVPQNAVEKLYKPTSGITEAEYSVIGFSVSEVDDWYVQQLPSGAQWTSWTWCVLGGGVAPPPTTSGFSSQRVWYRADGRRLSLLTKPGQLGDVRILILEQTAGPGQPRPC